MSDVKELIYHGQFPAAETCTCAVCTGVRRERTPLPIGLTYRQLDYWARSGYLRPDGNNQGSGRFRTWPSTELEIAARMVRLVDLGFTVATAARVARGDLSLTADIWRELRAIQRAISASAIRWEVEDLATDDLATDDLATMQTGPRFTASRSGWYGIDGNGPPRYLGPDKPG